jgi:hypothetical protein
MVLDHLLLYYVCSACPALVVSVKFHRFSRERPRRPIRRRALCTWVFVS